MMFKSSLSDHIPIFSRYQGFLAITLPADPSEFPFVPFVRVIQPAHTVDASNVF